MQYTNAFTEYIFLLLKGKENDIHNYIYRTGLYESESRDYNPFRRLHM